MWVSPAWAHGSASGALDTNLGLLVFIPAIIGFVLFLVFVNPRKGWTVLVAGGAGTIGGALVPKLLKCRHRAVVLDLYPHGDPGGGPGGDGVFEDIRNHVNLRQVKGDIGDPGAVREALKGCDAVILLADIAGDAFAPFVRAAKKAGVKRFIHASSENGDGGHTALCQKMLAEESGPGFVTCVVNPAAVSGSAPRQRPGDLFNALTGPGDKQGDKQDSGADGKRPPIHIDDMADLYLFLLAQPDARMAERAGKNRPQ